MSVQYLLDGYNAIYQIPKLAAKKTLREAREALVRLLIAGNFTGSARNGLTVVFDGQPGVSYDRSLSSIKVIFACGQTADDLIRTMVDQAAAKKNIYAITDDKALAQSVRALGAKTISIRDFFATMLQGPKAPSKARGVCHMQEEKYISATAACKINDELKEVWLR
jgi:predicted RNA-binding protein with PIN domain